MHGLVVGIFCA